MIGIIAHSDSYLRILNQARLANSVSIFAAISAAVKPVTSIGSGSIDVPGTLKARRSRVSIAVIEHGLCEHLRRHLDLYGRSCGEASWLVLLEPGTTLLSSTGDDSVCASLKPEPPPVPVFVLMLCHSHSSRLLHRRSVQVVVMSLILDLMVSRRQHCLQLAV